MSDVALSAGVARVVITPPVGSPMEGFLGRPVSDAVHDDLTASAVVILDAATDVASGPPNWLVLVSCDLVALESPEIESIAEKVAERTGIPADRVVVNCSHTHYGPVISLGDNSLLSAPGPQTRAYLENLCELIAGCVQVAFRKLQPCRLLAARGSAQIGVNRRLPDADGDVLMQANPTGVVDHRVEILRIDATDGSPIAVIFNHACHAVSLGARCTEFSADFPGVARRLIEQETGAMALFMQSAAGDVNPVLFDPDVTDWTYPVRLGLPLGAEVVRIYGLAEQLDSSGRGIAFADSTVHLPPLLPQTEDEALRQIAELEDEERNLIAAGGGSQGSLLWIRGRLERLKSGLEALRGGAPLPSRPARIVAASFDRTTAMVTCPAEVFTAIASGIRDATSFEHVLYSGYSNGYLHYLPTRAAYSEGGYEVTHACVVGPDAAGIVTEASLALLRSLSEG